MTAALDVQGSKALIVDTAVGDYIFLSSARPMLEADLLLPAPGGPSSLSSSCRIAIDTTPPYVKSVSAQNPTGCYSTANNLTLSVDFSLPVVAYGTSTIALNLVPLGRTAHYLSGSGSTTLLFRYTVVFPDVAKHFDYLGPAALSLNGGSILRLSTIPTTPANLSLPWGNMSLASRYNISVDYKESARVIKVASPLPDGRYGVGQEVPIIVTFSSAVSLFNGDATLILDTKNLRANSSTRANMSVASFVGGNGTTEWNFLYIAREGDNTTAINIFSANSLYLQSGNTTAIDSNGNIATILMYPDAQDVRALNYSSRIALDEEQPRVIAVTTTLPNGTYGIGQAIDFEVTFTLPVTVVGQPRLQIQTFYLRPDAQAKYINGSGSRTLTFVYITEDQDWAQGLPAARSQLVDYDGVSALYKLSGGDSSRILRCSTHPRTLAVLWLPQQDRSTLAPYKIRVDPDPPRVLGVSTATLNGTYGAGEEILITVTFTAPVTVYGKPTLLLGAVNNNKSRVFATFHGGNNTATISYLYLVNEGDASSQLDYADTRLAPYSVDIPASAALTVSDYWFHALQLLPIPGQPLSLIKRRSTHPITDADLTLPLPGLYGSLSYRHTIRIDTSPPGVVMVITNVPDGTYGSGYIIDILVVFSAPVVVAGTPHLLLETGVDDRLAPYISGNGTEGLTFRYVVQAGDMTSQLDYVASDSLLLTTDSMWKTDGISGSSIKRLATNPSVDANIALPPPGRAASILSPKSLVGSGHLITVQTANLFVVSVTAGVPDGRYGAGHEIPISVTFTENVTVVGYPSLLLNVPVGRGAQYLSGSSTRILNFLYRVRVGDNTDRLGYTSRQSLLLDNAVVSSLNLGQRAVVTLPFPGTNGSLDHDRSIKIDTTTAWVTNVVAMNRSGVYGAGDQLIFVINFSAPVVLLDGTPELLLRLDNQMIGHSKCSQPIEGEFSGMLLCSYTVEKGHEAACLEYYDERALVLDRSVILRMSTVPLGAVDGRLPCPGSNGSISAGGTLGISPEPNGVKWVTALTPDGTYGDGDQIDFLLRFLKPVKVKGQPILVMNSAPSSSAQYVSGSGTDALTFSMIIGPDDSTSDLDYRGVESLLADRASGAVIEHISSTGGQDVSLSLPLRGGSGSLGYNADITVDSSVPRIVEVSTPLKGGSYGSQTEVLLEVTFSANITVRMSPEGLWPSILMRSGTSRAVSRAVFQEQKNSRRLDFVFVIDESLPPGRIGIDGPDAFLCPVRACVISMYGERANVRIPRSGLTHQGNGSSILHDTTVALLSEMFVLGTVPPVGLAAGDLVTIGARFSSPILADLVDRPRLVLNLRPDGSAVAHYNHTMGSFVLVFLYQIQAGDCAVALDYADSSSLLGLVRRRSNLNTSVIPASLPPPGTEGSISYSRKIPVACEAPHVEGIFPLKVAGTYVEGEVIFIVVRFSQPVMVFGKPTLMLRTGGNITAAMASYYPYRHIADNMNFEALPTDVVFLYRVHQTDLTERLVHGGPWAIGLYNASIMRAAKVPIIPADIKCGDPTVYEGEFRGQWLADYPKRIELLIRDLWHEDAGDLEIALTHANVTVKVMTNNLPGKTFGVSDVDGVSRNNRGIGYDYIVGDTFFPDVASSAIATQSSTLLGASAERAIDGNIDGRFSYSSVVHTGVTAGAEDEPWWQLRFLSDNQRMATVHLWSRIQETDVNEIQTVTVAGAQMPQGTFALSIVLDNTNMTTFPISVRAPASTSEVVDGETVVSMQSRLEELGALGSIRVTRTRSEALLGYTWSITFLTHPTSLRLLEITHRNVTSPGVKYLTSVLQKGSARDWYGSMKGSSPQYQSRLFPCYVMVFNASVVPQRFSNLLEALGAALWSTRLEIEQRLSVIHLPAGIRGKYLRIQLEGNGYLSFSEVQVSDPNGSKGALLEFN